MSTNTEDLNIQHTHESGLEHSHIWGDSPHHHDQLGENVTGSVVNDGRAERQARREAAMQKGYDESASAAERLGMTFPAPTVKAHALIGEDATVEASETPRKTYRERREARAERLREWAEKREAKADATLAAASEKADRIPFGQPILIGHHSEGRDRRYRESISRGMERGLEHQAKADDMNRRASGIESQLAGSIYDDDPDAIERLRERIAALEAERDALKAYNASCRKGQPDPSLLTDRQRRNLEKVMATSSYSIGKNGSYPSYSLTNLSGNIKRNKDRLSKLERRAQS